MMVKFGTLTPNGVKYARIIKQSDIGRCPHRIMVSEHYRKNGTCRCDDPKHTEMREWGYTWNGKWE